MKLINLTGDYLNYLRKMTDQGKTNGDLWQALCYQQAPEVYDHVYQIYSQIHTSTDLHQAVFEYMTPGRLEEKLVHTQDLDQRLNSIAGKFKDLGFKWDEEAINPIYCLVGNGRVDGIVTGFRGGSMFLFAEYLPSDHGLDILLSHELTHLIQNQTPSNHIEKPQLGDYLFNEGLAMQMSRVLCPGHEDVAYTMTEDKPDRWAYVQANFHTIKDLLSSEDPGVIGDYLHMGSLSHQRLGYEMGYFLVGKMLESKTALEWMYTPRKVIRESIGDYFIHLMEEGDDF